MGNLCDKGTHERVSTSTDGRSAPRGRKLTKKERLRADIIQDYDDLRDQAEQRVQACMRDYQKADRQRRAIFQECQGRPTLAQLGALKRIQTEVNNIKAAKMKAEANRDSYARKRRDLENATMNMEFVEQEQKLHKKLGQLKINKTKVDQVLETSRDVDADMLEFNDDVDAVRYSSVPDPDEVTDEVASWLLAMQMEDAPPSSHRIPAPHTAGLQLSGTGAVELAPVTHHDPRDGDQHNPGSLILANGLSEAEDRRRRKRSSSTTLKDPFTLEVGSRPAHNPHAAEDDNLLDEMYSL